MKDKKCIPSGDIIWFGHNDNNNVQNQPILILLYVCLFQIFYKTRLCPFAKWGRDVKKNIGEILLLTLIVEEGGGRGAL